MAVSLTSGMTSIFGLNRGCVNGMEAMASTAPKPVHELESVAVETPSGDKPQQETQSEPKNWKKTASKAFWTGLGAWTTYSLADSGVANLLGLETLRHGTSWKGYIGINLNGGDPNRGGSAAGSSAGSESQHHVEMSKNYFYLFKDSEMSAKSSFGKGIFKEACGQIFNSSSCPEFPMADAVAGSALKRGLPVMHKVLSGAAAMGAPDATGAEKVVRRVVGGVGGFFTPTLNFRVRPEDIQAKGLENDPEYNNMAYRTHQKMGTEHLGITGSLRQGLGSGLIDRICARPGQAALGVALLCTAVYAAKKTYDCYNSSQAAEPTPEGRWNNCKAFAKKWVVVPTAALALICYNTL